MSSGMQRREYEWPTWIAFLGTGVTITVHSRDPKIVALVERAAEAHGIELEPQPVSWKVER